MKPTKVTSWWSRWHFLSFAYVFKTDSIPKSSILNFNIITYIRLSSEFRVLMSFPFHYLILLTDNVPSMRFTGWTNTPICDHLTSPYPRLFWYIFSILVIFSMCIGTLWNCQKTYCFRKISEGIKRKYIKKISEKLL